MVYLNFSELLKTIIGSSSEEWHWMIFVLKNDIGGHDSQITYLKDLSITIRFGLRNQNEIITDNLKWLDSSIVPPKKNAFRYLDLCYNGMPIIRMKYIAVKGDKYLLPIPEIPSDDKAEIHPDELLLFEWLNSTLMFVFGNRELTNSAIKKYIVWLPSHFGKTNFVAPHVRSGPVSAQTVLF